MVPCLCKGGLRKGRPSRWPGKRIVRWRRRSFSEQARTDELRVPLRKKSKPSKRISIRNSLTDGLFMQWDVT